MYPLRVAAFALAGIGIMTSVPAPTALPQWHDTRAGSIYQPAQMHAPTLPYGRVTGYCHCTLCCKKDDGITASGAPVTEGVTVAADPRVYRLGSCVWIEGLGRRIVQDVGSAIKGNRLDVYFASHDEALAFGSQYLRIERCK
jgi:3D (Asp-Asp-Asp) domain-containing protein